jgi:hypothetical protein
LFEAGAGLGERLMPELVRLLDGPAVSYGKGALVGVDGEMEHGGACVHPMLGRPMRAALGGGQALIGSNVKVAAPGMALDVPLGHKDEAWSFEHFDTITVSVPDAPRPDDRRDHGDCGWRPARKPLRHRADPLTNATPLQAGMPAAPTDQASRISVASGPLRPSAMSTTTR